MELGEPDRSGRRRPVPVEGSNFVIAANTIISAVGQSTDTGFLYNDLPLRLNKWGDVDIDGFSMQTSELKMFCRRRLRDRPRDGDRGDCSGPTRRGRYRRVRHQRLRHGRAPRTTPAAVVRSRTCRATSSPTFPRLPRAHGAELDVADRFDGFPEVEFALTEEQARAEAARCLTCGCSKQNHCALRDAASSHGVQFELPLHIRPRAPIVKDHPFIIRDQNKCISCGLCVAACAEVVGPGVLAFQFKDGRLTRRHSQRHAARA